MIKFKEIIINKLNMLFDFLKKQDKRDKKIILLSSLIKGLQIPENQKEMYLWALEVLEESELDNFYKQITAFVHDVEIKKISDIHKSNFSSISWLKKKEAEEQKEELNSLNLLLDNI